MISIADIARVCHEANRAFCIAKGDHTVSTWDMLPETVQLGIIDDVRYASTNPAVTPQQLHERWAERLVAEGWQRGAVHAPDLLESPDLVDYVELTDDAKSKQRLFCSIVKSFEAPDVFTDHDKQEGLSGDEIPVVLEQQPKDQQDAIDPGDFDNAPIQPAVEVDDTPKRKRKP